MRARALAAACLLAAATAHPVAADTWGLVVGIDDYVYQRPLTGAVNDARDIAQAMQTREMRDVVVLLNQSASRDAIESAWKDLLDRAAPGDTIIFTYAGHGGQEPDLSGDEAAGDAYDEAFLLSDFTDRSARGLRERIVDDELNQWFADAAAKGVGVTFLADSCHSGTMTRQAVSTRYAGTYEPGEALTSAAVPGAAPATLDNVFFIAAVAEDKATPEVNIGGKMRGAASYAFARALEGAADGDRDGVTTRDELDDYIARAASTFSDQATPRVAPLSGGGAPVFGGAPITFAAAAPQVALTVATASGVMIGAVGARYIPDYGAATLNWDEARGEVSNSEGDVVAYDVFGKIALRRVVEKFRLIEIARTGASAAPFSVTLSGGARLWRVGEQTEIVIGPRKGVYLTALALGNAGEVSLLYPYTRSEAGAQNPDAAVRLGIEITRDGAGGEHVVAFATDAPPTALREAAAKGGAARAFLDEVKALVEGRTPEVGLARVLTAWD